MVAAPEAATGKPKPSGTDQWRHVPPMPAYSVFEQPIQKSPQDDRDYRIIQLQNGLQVMVIHDPNADKAAASLDVAVGHLFDPDDMPGLAHFCEHLLFMGTEQYPRENEYSEFLAKNNGYSNAYTSSCNTNYYFNVGTPALYGALQRFSAFFHCPLFSPSCTSRELNAVDSEHKKNHQSDMWRIFQVNKHLSKEGHVWSKFGSGNRESLSRVGRELKKKGLLVNGNGQPILVAKAVNGALAAKTNGVNGTSAESSQEASPLPTRGSSPAPSENSGNSEFDVDGGSVGRETRRRLIEWWQREYCASRMRLCIIGKENLDTLSGWVAQLFTPILNRGREPLPMITEHPFGAEQKGTLVSVQTIMDFHVLEMSFPLPDQPPLWRYKPAHFLAHFVGHEGPGSLHSYLKNKGWITALSSGAQFLARGFAMFKATIHLTAEGFQHHREVMLATLKYLNLLRNSPLPPWYQHEISQLAATRFRFAEKRRPDDYCVWLSEHMAWPVPRDLVVSAPQLRWVWDEEGMSQDANGMWPGEKEMRNILAALRVDQGRAVLMARQSEHEKVRGKEVKWESEPWYGTGYRVERFDQEFVREAEDGIISELFLPGPNEFIPTNLDVEKKEVAEPARRPFLIRETPLASLWHKKDDTYWVPKARFIMDLRTHLADVSPRESVMTRLYSDLVHDSLTEFAYDAELAGLNYLFMSHTLGIYINLSGYNDKLMVLARCVLKRARTLKVNPERLEIMKERLKRDWENFFLGQSYRISDYYGRFLMTEKQWTLEEKLPEIMSITPAEVESHIQGLLSKMNIRMLSMGNFRKEEAIRIAEMTEEILGSSPLSQTEVNESALIPRPSTNHIWSTLVPNANEPNSALTFYLHWGKLTDQHTRVLGSLLHQLISEPAFSVLRTKEQLGYVVSTMQWHLPGDTEVGIRIAVQSERPPWYLEERVETFLESLKDKLEDMDDAEFQEQKEGLWRKWMEKPKNLGEETNRYWLHIDSGHMDFYRRWEDAEALKSITKEEVMSMFMSHVHPSSPTRAKLSVHLRSQKPPAKKVSKEAQAAFDELVRKVGIVPADPNQLPDDQEPAMTAYVKHWHGALNGAPGADQDMVWSLLLAIPKLIEQHPVQGSGDGEPKYREGVTFIQDPKAYKASESLKVSDPQIPCEWGDLLPAATVKL